MSGDRVTQMLNCSIWGVQESEAALSREMEELCNQITSAAKAAAEDRAAAEKEIAELQSLLHAARADAAQVRCAAMCCGMPNVTEFEHAVLSPANVAVIKSSFGRS